MLSTSAFNAFLKTLEEPPRHAKFILATTEKNKIIPTILSRCQIFDFKRIGVNDIAAHLNFVAKSESVEVEEEALHLIAQKADGAMRDSLSLLDRLISFSDKKLTYKSVIEVLNILDYDYYFKVTDLLLQNDVQKLLNIYNEILQNGFDGHHFINGLADHLRDVLVSKNESTISLLEKGEVLQSRYVEQSKRCDLHFLLDALNLCNECDMQFKTTNNQRLLVELTLMRISSIGFVGEKKNSKSFVVSRNDVKGKVPVEQIAENNKKEPVLRDVKVTPNIKLDLGIKKRSSLISINSSFKKEKDIVEDDKDALTIRDKDFPETELLGCWKELIVFIKEKGKSNLGITLGSHQPRLLEGYLIELPLSNAVQAEMILEEKYMLLEYLRNKLENDKIEIATKIIEGEKNNIPYTNKDKFKIMLDENPQLEILRVKLGLDPDY